MTLSTSASVPAVGDTTLARQLALVIDLNICVGCHACVTSCKEWNTSGAAGPMTDENAYGANPTGTFFNRVQTWETGSYPETETIHFPKSCLHCADPPCVPVCPTGASYKRAEDGIVLVDYDKCIGCLYCSWACPYGAREFDEERQVMTKCTLCVDRVYDPDLAPQDRQPACVKACPTGARMFGDVNDPESIVSRAIRDRGGYELMPEWETKPANRYLPRRITAASPAGDSNAPAEGSNFAAGVPQAAAIDGGLHAQGMRSAADTTKATGSDSASRKPSLWQSALAFATGRGTP